MQPAAVKMDLDRPLFPERDDPQQKLLYSPSMSTQAMPNVQAPLTEPFVDPDTAADYLRTTRRHVLRMARVGLIPGYPLDPHAKKKDWRFLLSELRSYMLSCDERPPGARKP
ncbi:MAG TPA: helix-turn-helix domain-containing protein [Terriglobales bacterium]|nr:helix-turn-helix domain-containing protein [Terriglobales bacterium]